MTDTLSLPSSATKRRRDWKVDRKVVDASPDGPERDVALCHVNEDSSPAAGVITAAIMATAKISSFALRMGNLVMSAASGRQGFRWSYRPIPPFGEPIASLLRRGL